MEKVGVKKKVVRRIVPAQNPTEKILVENFVELQKVMTTLSENFVNLSSQISKLLQLFEVSAKTLAQKGFEDNKEIVTKIDSLLEQNKIIAKGISLLHEPEEVPEKQISPPLAPPQRPMPPNPAAPPIPKQGVPQPAQSQKQPPININEYQKSISTTK